MGVFLYTRATAAGDGVGRWAFRALIAFLGIVYVGNILGPPPPSVTALGWVALSLWLLVPWAAWIDRHRITAERDI